jgi:hypothetical protein
MHGGTGNVLLGVIATIYDYTDAMRDANAEFSVREALMLLAAMTAIRQAGRFLQQHLHEYVMGADDTEHTQQLAAQMGYDAEFIKAIGEAALEPGDLLLMHTLQVKAEEMLGRTLDDGSMDEADECDSNGAVIDWSDVFGTGMGEA